MAEFFMRKLTANAPALAFIEVNGPNIRLTTRTRKVSYARPRISSSACANNFAAMPSHALSLRPTNHMNGQEKSDGAVVALSRPNKQVQASAEVGEGRARTEENIVQLHIPDTGGTRMSQGLIGVRQVAAERKQGRFTALLTI
jgi:hypothetical protein